MGVCLEDCHCRQCRPDIDRTKNTFLFGEQLTRTYNQTPFGIKVIQSYSELDGSKFSKKISEVHVRDIRNRRYKEEN